MATRYWHWLLAQQQKKEKKNYEVRGTSDTSSVSVSFDPWADYTDHYDDYITINTNQNGNT